MTQMSTATELRLSLANLRLCCSDSLLYLFWLALGSIAVAQTGSFVPAGVYLLDFLTPGLQRCFSKAQKSPASHSSDMLATPARPERSWVPAAPQALASCLAPTCPAQGVLLLLCLFLIPGLGEGLEIGKGWAG